MAPRTVLSGPACFFTIIRTQPYQPKMHETGKVLHRTLTDVRWNHLKELHRLLPNFVEKAYEVWYVFTGAFSFHWLLAKKSVSFQVAG